MNTPSHGSKVARKDIPAAFQWKIQDIYATQEEWEKACTALKELIAELETCKGSLKDASILLQALQLQRRRKCPGSFRKSGRNSGCILQRSFFY